MAAPAALPPLLLLISAPSGAGKTTLCDNLLRSCSTLRRAVTCTTRAPRGPEQDGVDYHFLDAATFERRVARGDFLEQATVYGHRYGTLRSEVMDKLHGGFDVLLNVDVQGAASVRAVAAQDPALGAALITLFLTPPSLAILEQRLHHRATDSEEVIRGRLAVARTEAAEWRHFHYLLISGTPAEDLARAQTILAAERMRTARSSPPPL
jgi:guanylate kinase